MFSLECGGSTPLLRCRFDGLKKSRSATEESSVKPEHSKAISLSSANDQKPLALISVRLAFFSSASENQACVVPHLVSFIRELR